MDDATSRSDASVLLQLQASGRPAPRLRLEGSDAAPVTADAHAGAPIELRTSSRYEVVGEIAQGGVGVVMRGRDADLGRDVALKVLREDHVQSPDLLRRFVEEAQVGGQLQHPGIVPVYELGLQPDGRPFFAMKLVKGGTLAAALAARKNTDDDRRRFLAVFAQTCQTMAYVHSRGVVHRDLKPSNVMIGAFGEVQVVDWGFGKVLAHGGVADEKRAKREMKGATIVATVRSGSSGSESVAGSVMGTPAYMPPEQALGQIDRVDERSDVFALGSILCEILTGKPPYVGDDLLSQARQCRLKDAHARLHASGAEDDLVKLAIECLAPLPKDRPKSSGAVAAAVDAYLSDADDRAHRSKVNAVEAKANAEKARAAAQDSRAEAADRMRARRQTMVIAAAVLLMLAGAGWGWSSMASRREARGRTAAAAVDEAVQDATHLAASKDWAKALAAAERARDLASADGADPALAAKPDELSAAIRASEAAAGAAATQKVKDAAFLALLDDLRERALEDEIPARRAADFAAAFDGYGIHAASADPTQAAAQVRAALGDDAAPRVAAALDLWSVLAPAAPDAARPAALARAVDPDADRNRVRDAIATRDAGRLRGIASDAETISLQPPTISLIAAALRPFDASASTALLVRAFHRYPGDFWIELELASRLVGRARPGANRAWRHALAARALRPDSRGAILALARAQTRSGRPKFAADLLEDAIRRDPADADLHGALSEARFAAADFGAAAKEAREAVRLEPDEPEWRCGLATALAAASNLEGALDEARRLVQFASARPRAHECLGDVLLARGEVTEAITSFGEAVRLDPNRAAAHTGLGRALAAKGDAEGAEKELAAALALDPDDGVALWTRACVQRDGGGTLKVAKPSLEDALRLVPGGDDVAAAIVDEMGEVAVRLDDLDRAQYLFEYVLSLRSADARAHAGLGTVFQQSGEHDNAIAECRAALAVVLECKLRRAPVTTYCSVFALVPEEARIRARLGSSLRATGKLDEAIEEFRLAANASPKDWSFRHELGAALLEKGAFREALEPLREAVRLKPDAAAAQDDLGRAALANGRADEALAAFRAAVEADITLAAPHRHLGEFLLDRTGDFAAAKDELESARDMESDDASVRLSLARALLAVGDVDPALVELRAALHLDPDDTETLLALTLRLAATGRDDESIAIVRETARANPASAPMRACLGAALASRGRTGEALTELRAARDGGATKSGAWAHAESAASWLAQAERMAAAEPRLDAALRDPRAVADADGSIAMAQLCAARGDAASATAFYRAAFAASPRHADDLVAGHRLAAARAAARAADAAARQPKPPAKPVLASLRGSALEWLRADLAARRAQASSGDVGAAGDARATLALWRCDSQLAALRDGAELDKLPPGERDGWRALWHDVDEALTRK
jgi:serine/threonine-protein kinase